MVIVNTSKRKTRERDERNDNDNDRKNEVVCLENVERIEVESKQRTSNSGSSPKKHESSVLGSEDRFFKGEFKQHNTFNNVTTNNNNS